MAIASNQTVAGKFWTLNTQKIPESATDITHIIKKTVGETEITTHFLIKLSLIDRTR